MAEKQAKKTVNFVIEDHIRGRKIEYVGHGSYVLLYYNEDDEGGHIHSRAVFNFGAVNETENTFLTLIKVMKTMIARRPYLMSLLLDYLDGDFPDEFFKKVSQEDEATAESCAGSECAGSAEKVATSADGAAVEPPAIKEG